MNDFALVGLFLVGLFLIVRTSGWLVSILTWMARYLKMSEYAVAFILMASATSIPELFVGVNSAAAGIPGLALGNVLGANLLNVTLVIGVVALVRNLTMSDERLTHGVSFIFALTVTPLILLLDGALSRPDGAILIFLFFAYLRYLFVVARIPDSAVNALVPTAAAFREFVKKIFLFVGAVVLLLVASRIVVFAAGVGAERLGIPPFLIGLIVISLGTTLPELAFGLRSAMVGMGSMSLGNAVGSVIFNVLFILGVAALIQPIEIAGNTTAIFLNLLMVTAALLVLHIVLRLFGRIPRGVGILLITDYVVTALSVWQLSFGS